MVKVSLGRSIILDSTFLFSFSHIFFKSFTFSLVLIGQISKDYSRLDLKLSQGTKYKNVGVKIVVFLLLRVFPASCFP